jgi:parvulin-like peptidyl-prolyl isomerase
MMKKPGTFLFLLLVGFGAFLSGCGGLNSDAAVSVSGVIITKQDVEAQIDYRNKIFPGMVSRDDEVNFPKIRRQTTKDMVSTELEAQEAKRRGITVVVTEVEDELQTMSEVDFLGDVSRMMEDYASKGVTDADLRRVAAEKLIHEKLAADVKKDISVSEDEIQKYYEKNQNTYNQSELRQTRQIVTGSQAAALDAASRVNAGESFVDVAKRVSIDPQASKNGGSLGLVAPGKLPPELEAVLFKMSVGQVSDPINVADKWYVLTVELVQPGQAMSIDQTRAGIRQIIADEAMAERWKSFVDDLYNNASLEFDPEYNPNLT